MFIYIYAILVICAVIFAYLGYAKKTRMKFGESIIFSSIFSLFSGWILLILLYPEIKNISGIGFIFYGILLGLPSSLLANIAGFFIGTRNNKEFICNHKGHKWGEEVHKEAYLWEKVCERCGKKGSINKRPAPTFLYKCSNCGKEVRNISDLKDFSSMYIRHKDICKSCYDKLMSIDWQKVDENRW